MTQIDLLTFSMRTKAPSEGADWFRIENKKGGPSKVYIYDEIGYWGTTAKDFAAIVSGIESDEIHLHLNSPGGSVFDGLAIMAALRDHPAKVVGYVDGMAASAASFILQAADERLISRNAQVMIHDASAYAGGNAEKMRQAADLLDRVSDNIADIYAVRSGQGTMESWRDIMRSGDTWYGGNEALAAGLVDAVTDNPVEDEEEGSSASNTWSIEDVSAFFKTSPDKLAASGKHVAITNRVEEAQMTGSNPINTPPPVGQPVAQVAEEPTAALTGLVACVINGVESMVPPEVKAHIEGLSAFKAETIEAGRKSFVAGLVGSGKILANEETVASAEKFALGLSASQFEEWRSVMDSAASNPLFGSHGINPGDTQAPANSVDDDTAHRISILQEVVDSHRASGMSEAVIATKASYKELQQLKSAATGAEK